MFEKIVVGFDGSETSENALRLACDIAGKYGSEMHVIHTPQPHTVAFAMGAVAGYHAVTTMPAPAEVKQANDKMIAAAQSVVDACHQPLAQVHIGDGDPADAIVGCAEKYGADLIVTGRRGLGALGSIVQGSTSLRVNHLAKCASLSVV